MLTFQDNTASNNTLQQYKGTNQGPGVFIYQTPNQCSKTGCLQDTD